MTNKEEYEVNESEIVMMKLELENKEALDAVHNLPYGTIIFYGEDSWGKKMLSDIAKTKVDYAWYADEIGNAKTDAKCEMKLTEAKSVLLGDAPNIPKSIWRIMKNSTIIVCLDEEPPLAMLSGNEALFNISRPSKTTMLTLIEKYCESENFHFDDIIASEIALLSSSPKDLCSRINRRMISKHIHEFATKNNLFAHSGNKFAFLAAWAYKSLLGDGGALYFYGPTGSGLSTLLLTIHKNAEGYKVYYKAGFEFYEQLIDAIREGTTRQFRAKLLSYDLILIDDIDCSVAHRVSWSEELGHVIHKMADNGKIVMMTGKTRIKDIAGCHDYLERAVSTHGMQVGLEQLDFSDRCRYVIERCTTENQYLYFTELVKRREMTAATFRELDLELMKAKMPNEWETN